MPLVLSNSKRLPTQTQENSMDYSKSSSGRTVWTVDQGRLHESSPDFAQFVLTATDTKTLLDLLKRNEDEIKKAAAQELRAVAHNG